MTDCLTDWLIKRMTHGNAITQSRHWHYYSTSSLTFSINLSLLLWILFPFPPLLTYPAVTHTHAHIYFSYLPHNNPTSMSCKVHTRTYREIQAVPPESLRSAPRPGPHCSPHYRDEARGVTRALLTHPSLLTGPLLPLFSSLFSLVQGCQPPRIQRYLRQLLFPVAVHAARRWCGPGQGSRSPDNHS